MENTEVARIFEEVADLLEIQSANAFRVRAYRSAARMLYDLPEPLIEIASSPQRRLEELPGIGKDLAAKIATILATGDLPLRQELMEKAPAQLREFLNVPGLGPKRAMLLHKELGIRSLADLRQAARDQRIRAVKGFGAKTEDAILQGLEKLEETGRRIYYADAKPIADALLGYLKQTPGLGQIAIAGSFRRLQETIGDLDMLMTCADPSTAMDRLAAYPAVVQVLARGDTKMSVRLRLGLQMDLRVVPAESFGAALQYFTGSKEHNIVVRRRAIARGLKVNEYGVFRDEQLVAGRTEEEIYESIGLPWIPPELREGRREFELVAQQGLPELLELQMVRGDLHMHTDATDGRATIEQMIVAALEMKYEYIAITDHSKRVAMAGGLDADRLRAHWRAIDEVARNYPQLPVLKGVEMDILEDGRLDLPDDVLREADWVIASIHYGQNQPAERLTQRLLNAVRHPYVSAIGHPTGRIIGRRRSYEVDMESVLDAAVEHGCLMELNCQPARLDLAVPHLVAAQQRGIPIVLSTDAHSVDELRFMPFGVNQARRAGLAASDVANARSYSEFRKLLKKQ